MRLIIEDDAGRKLDLTLDADVITVGRDESNDIRLPERNVSRQHCRFLRSAEGLLVEDLQSANGLWLNGRPITGRQQLSSGDRLGIGDYTLLVADAPAAGSSKPPAGGATPPSEQGAAVPAMEGAQAHPHAPSPGRALGPKRKPTPIPKFPGLPPAFEVTPGPVGAPQRRSADPTSGTRIVILTTELAGTSLALPNRQVWLGAGPESEIILAHRSLEARHCKIEPVAGGGWFFARARPNLDLSVNGVVCDEAVVHHGDTVRIGSVLLRLVPA